MGGKPKGRGRDDASGKPSDEPAGLKTVKVTLHLAFETAQRLGIESAMRRVSQSAIAEEVLAGYLKRWQLPEAVDPNRQHAG